MPVFRKGNFCPRPAKRDPGRAPRYESPIPTTEKARKGDKNAGEGVSPEVSLATFMSELSAVSGKQGAFQLMAGKPRSFIS